MNYLSLPPQSRQRRNKALKLTSRTSSLSNSRTLTAPASHSTLCACPHPPRARFSSNTRVSAASLRAHSSLIARLRPTFAPRAHVPGQAGAGPCKFVAPAASAHQECGRRRAIYVQGAQRTPRCVDHTETPRSTRHTPRAQDRPRMRGPVCQRRASSRDGAPLATRALGAASRAHVGARSPQSCLPRQRGTREAALRWCADAAARSPPALRAQLAVLGRHSLAFGTRSPCVSDT
ncbi:hypothetical protein FB451DRAFT_1399244 [Mycena latifolia]|nr:hypothetical protein FB451DRAFT_1399244 [Mycena latifolia]